MALDGNIDLFDRQSIKGWAIDHENMSTPVTLLVTIDDQPEFQVLANGYRADLEQAGFGFGRHGFTINLHGLSPTQTHTVQITREDGSHVRGSPLSMQASPRFDDDFQQQLAAILMDTDETDELASRAAFLAQQADRLLQVRADRRAGRPSPTVERQFRVRWTGQGPDPYQEAKPRALVIDDVLPVPSRDAGSCAVISHMHSLQRLGYEVVFAPSDMAGGPASALLEAAGISCCCAPWCGSVEEVLRREHRSFKLVYIHRNSNARYMPMVRYHQPRARIVFSVADLQHLRLARQATVEQRPELTEASKQIRNVELSAGNFADRVITHSTVEAAMLVQSLPKQKVHVVPWTVRPQPTAVPLQQRSGLAFIGSYGHLPNLDAAWWLVQELMPLVRARDASIECLLVGSNMPDALRAAVGPGIRPLGHVDDLNSVFDQVRLTIAPLTFGAGVKGKVLESLAAGVACACTPIAAEGMDWSGTLIETIGENANAVADIVVRLHTDLAFNAACTQAGLDYVTEHLSEARIDQLMADAVGTQAA